MAKTRTSVKPGQILNPKGRPSGTSHIPKEVKQYNSKIISEIMSKYITMDAAELEKIISDKSLPVIDIIIARILATSIQKSDSIRFNFILERMIGKVPDRIDHTSSDGTMSPPKPLDLSKYTDEELAQLRKLKEKSEC